MRASQRRVHAQIWLVLGPLTLAVIAVALLVRPPRPALHSAPGPPSAAGAGAAP